MNSAMSSVMCPYAATKSRIPRGLKKIDDLSNIHELDGRAKCVSNRTAEEAASEAVQQK